jgi:hypothetical protein
VVYRLLEETAREGQATQGSCELVRLMAPWRRDTIVAPPGALTTIALVLPGMPTGVRLATLRLCAGYCLEA